MSIPKTSFFTCGLSQEETSQIVAEIGLEHGQLPVRYLGVLLVTKKISLENCEPLIQQVKGKVNSWSAKSLSFAGTLLLINTVLEGISNFWCSIFTIPKQCIKIINSICGAYLWRGTTEGHHTARVAWETVVLPKEEGGLGIRDLHFWNKACSIRLIWLLFFRAGSIWVAWFLKNILRNCKSNFWTLKEKQSHSHSVKKLLRVRKLAYSWIRVELGNGANTRFWTDNWSPFGNIHSFLNRQSSTLDSRATATISDIYANGVWSLPSPRSDNQLALHTHLTTVSLSNTEDVVVWCPLGSSIDCCYSTGMIYNLIRDHKPHVAWCRAVWTSRGIPKHNFLTWLVNLNRCPTKDRMLNWGLQTDGSCVLCNSALESRDHIFFECNYSFSIWNTLARKVRSSAIRHWNQAINHMQSLSSPKHVRLLTLLAWQAAIYAIWMEINSRIHRKEYRNQDSLIATTASLIKNRISSTRDTSPALSSKMMQIWLED